jgi:hypothetical protein
LSKNITKLLKYYSINEKTENLIKSRNIKLINPPLVLFNPEIKKYRYKNETEPQVLMWPAKRKMYVQSQEMSTCELSVSLIYLECKKVIRWKQNGMLNGGDGGKASSC